MGEAVVEKVFGCIEELASSLVVQSDSVNARAVWSLSLLQLAEFARSAGQAAVAGIAEDVARTLKNPTTPASELGETLERGLTALREAAGAAQPATPAAPPPVSIADDPELIADFVLESREHLDNIEAQLLSIEQNARNTEALHSIFRSFHTIKGLAGFLEFPLIQQVAHEVETVLDKARQGDFLISGRPIDIILESKDYIADWLRYLDSGRSGECPLSISSNGSLVARIQAVLLDEDSASQVASMAAASAGAETGVRSLKESARVVKVDTAKLDYLVDMVGEMVIAQSMVRHDPDLAIGQNPRLARNLSQLVRTTDEVQRTAMSMRMVPIGPLFQKMARLVRDLARKFGKQVQFECDGEDVEIDRNIVEEIADPLMHMVRNAIDHGVEPPDVRVKHGKQPNARVFLQAFHRSGQIVIQVSDDGRGIDREKVIEKARVKGLISPNANLTDSECFNLIFQPGFSTARQVSDVSGRGVGMDVVKRHIAKLRGSVDIDSTAGQGTRFSLRLPLTLAIIDGLVVAVGTERYIIPLAAVKEMLRPTVDMLTTVENRAEVVVIRDRMIPMIRLYERFGAKPRSTDPTEAVLIVADNDGAAFCLMVDELVGKQEVVIKSLGPMFQHVSGVAGGAILGDGQVGLILDLSTLFGDHADA